MKNTILGVILAYIIPHISTDIWFIATWMLVGATVALALVIALRMLTRNAELELKLADTEEQLAWSEQRRMFLNRTHKVVRRRTKRTTKPSMRKGGAA